LVTELVKGANQMLGSGAGAAKLATVKAALASQKKKVSDPEIEAIVARVKAEVAAEATAKKAAAKKSTATKSAAKAIKEAAEQQTFIE
jgi:hypothetical protein